MAVSYPGISFLRGYEPKDALEQFAKGFGFGEGVRNEAQAKDALSAYIDSLTGGQSQARPAASDALVRGSADAAEAAADPMLTAYFANTRRSESGGNDAARNPNSTATGRYQFLEGTWNDLASRHPQLGLTPDGRTDPAQQERAMKVFTAENARALKGSGIPVNPGTLYAAHFLGPGGASKVLAADPNASVASMLDPSVVQANPQLGQMTVAQFQQWANEKGGNGSGGYAPPMAGGIAAQRPSGDVLKALMLNPVTREFGMQLAHGKGSGQQWQQFTGKDGKMYQVDTLTGKVDAIGGGGVNVTVDNGGASEEFYKKLDTDAGAQTAALIDAGRSAASNNMRLKQLETHLANAPQGATGAIVQFAGSLGIPIDGMDDLQAAQALINQMVPGQRPPGSGTMSDADLVLYKQSLPSIINQPGGNQLIIRTTMAVNDYTIEQARIAEMIANREITPAEGRAMQRNVPNPLAGLNAPAPQKAPPLPDGVTEEDIVFTMQKHGLSREQVLERVGGP